MTLTATIAATGVSVLVGTLKFGDRIDQRSTAAFTVKDEAVSYFAQNQVVVVSETAMGDLFVGFVEGIELDRLTPQTTRFHTVTCKDHHWLAEKRLYIDDEVSGKLAGDIACQVHQDYLAAEGVTASYAMRRDHNATGFGQGTLTGVSGANGYLELSPGGSTYNKKESTTADFNAFSYEVNTSGYENQLELSAHNSIKLTGATEVTGSGNKYAYYKIWGGSQLIASGDYLEYQIWISSTSPEIKGGVDVVCTDGHNMRDNAGNQPALDQFQISCHPNTDLKGYADDQWFYRKINAPSQMVGKTIQTCVFALEGEAQGTYTAYVFNVLWCASNGTIKGYFYNGGLNASQLLGNVGYHNVVISNVTTYDGHGIRESNAYSIASTGMVHSSVISWLSYEPQGSTENPALVIETSLDNKATWQKCTNYGAIPCLLVGSLTAGKNVYIRQTLNIAGPNPELSPILYEDSITVLPGYNASKTDVSHYDIKGSMGDGTLSHVINGASGVNLDGYYRDWDDADLSGQIIYGGVGGNSAQSCYYRQLQIRADPSGYDGRSQFVFAGQHTNFTTEIDIKLVDSTGIYGMLYRTTYWGHTANTFAYCAQIGVNQVTLGRGTNTSVGGWTQIATFATTFSVGQWYRLRIVVNGSNHQVFVDDVRYINATDGTFAGAGYFGARSYNGGAVRASGLFDNFGLQDYDNGYRTAPSVSISGVGTVLNSYIAWDADVPSNSTLDIQASVDGGTNYYSCTNGGVIPGCEAGQNVSGKSLLIKAVFTAINSSVTPLLKGVGWLIAGSFSVSGNRISPALSANSVGYAGSSSVAWIADVPTNTTLTVQSSSTGIGSWTTIASSGDPIAGVNGNGTLLGESFASNNSADWSSTFYSGGAVATYTWDTANSRLQTNGGTNACYVWNKTGASADDVEIAAILHQSNSGGILARYTDVGNHYRLMVYDDTSTSGYQQKVRLIKRVGGVNTTLQDNIAIDFARGTYHTIKWKILGQIHTVWWDGVQVINYDDATGISAAGKMAFFNNGGDAYWQLVNFLAIGDSMAGKNYYTKVILASTEPTLSPKVYDLTLSVRSSDLISGEIVPSTDYKDKTKISGVLDDCTKRSSAWWTIRKDKSLTIKDRPDELAPWPLYSADVNFQYTPRPKLYYRSPLYRNKHYVYNAVDTVNVTEQKVGTGYTSSWALRYKVKSIQGITWNGQPQTFGLKDIDTNKAFYYTIGEQVFMLDTAVATPPGTSEVVTVEYTGQKKVTKFALNQLQIDALALVDNSTGLVEASEDGGGMSGEAAQALADARIAQYAILSRDWQFTTSKAGLKAGQMLYIYVPEFGLNDVGFFITSVTTTLYLKADTSIAAYYDVECTEGPNIGSWSKLFIVPS